MDNTEVDELRSEYVTHINNELRKLNKYNSPQKRLTGFVNSPLKSTSPQKPLKKKSYKRDLDNTIKKYFTENKHQLDYQEAITDVVARLSKTGSGKWSEYEIDGSMHNIKMGITYRGPSFGNIQIMKDGLSNMSVYGNRYNWDNKKNMTIFHTIVFPRVESDNIPIDIKLIKDMLTYAMNSFVGGTLLTQNYKGEFPLQAIYANKSLTKDERDQLYDHITNLTPKLATTIFTNATNKLTLDTVNDNIELIAWALFTYPNECINVINHYIKTLRPMNSVYIPHSSVKVIISTIALALSKEINGSKYALERFFKLNEHKQKDNTILNDIFNFLCEQSIAIDAELTNCNTQEIINQYNIMNQIIGYFMGELARCPKITKSVVRFVKNNIKINTDVSLLKIVRLLSQVLFDINGIYNNISFIKLCEQTKIIENLIDIANKPSLTTKIRFNIIDILEKVYNCEATNITKCWNDSNNKQNAMSVAVSSRKNISELDISTQTDEMYYTFKNLTEDDITNHCEEFTYTLCEHGTNKHLLKVISNVFKKLDTEGIFSVEKLKSLINNVINPCNNNSNKIFTFTDIKEEYPKAEEIISDFMLLLENRKESDKIISAYTFSPIWNGTCWIMQDDNTKEFWTWSDNGYWVNK